MMLPLLVRIPLQSSQGNLQQYHSLIDLAEEEKLDDGKKMVQGNAAVDRLDPFSWRGFGRVATEGFAQSGGEDAAQGGGAELEHDLRVDMLWRGSRPAFNALAVLVMIEESLYAPTHFVNGRKAARGKLTATKIGRQNLRRTIGQGDLDQADALARTEAAFDPMEGAELPLLFIQIQVDHELILAGFEERFDRLDAAVKRDANDEFDLLVVEHGIEAGAGVAAIADEKDAFLQLFAGQKELALAAIEEAPIGIVGELIEDVVEQDHAKLWGSVGDAVVELAFLLGDAGAVSCEHRRWHVERRTVGGDDSQSARLGRDSSVRMQGQNLAMVIVDLVDFIEGGSPHGGKQFLARGDEGLVAGLQAGAGVDDLVAVGEIADGGIDGAGGDRQFQR